MDPALSTSQAEAPASNGSGKAGAPSRVCVVTLGGELFAIDLRCVREVFELESVTPVPGMA